jgi:hypothetical protein
MYTVLNFFLIVLHGVLLFFNIFGWIPRRTRLLHLITMLLTAGSWFLIGPMIWGWLNGLNVCVITEWHNSVRTKLDYPPMTNYASYLLNMIPGVEADMQDGEYVVGAGAVFALLGMFCVYTWYLIQKRSPFSGRRFGKQTLADQPPPEVEQEPQPAASGNMVPH